MSNIYLTGDTHGNVFDRMLYLKHNYNLIQSENILIVIGDLGLVWDNKYYKQVRHIERYIKDNNLNLKILSVKGNHENFDIINTLPKVKLFGSEVIQVSDNIYFLENGNLYEIFGNKFAVFGGALSIDKHLRNEGVTWWGDEIPSKKIMSKFVDELDKVDTRDYILLTHTTATDEIYSLDLYPMEGKLTDDVAQYLNFIKKHYMFKTHYFAHFHMNKFVEETNSMCLFKYIIKL